MFKIPIITISVMAKSELMNNVYNLKVLIERTNPLYTMLTTDIMFATCRLRLHLPLIPFPFITVAPKLDGIPLNFTVWKYSVKSGM